MTVDARALVAIARKEPGFEGLVAQVVEDENPRVCATAVAEAAIILSTSGDWMSQLTLDVMIGQLGITVVPFTQDHWRAAVDAYQRGIKAGVSPAPAFGRCLSVAVAAKLGAPLIE
jgi:ribonuclease VapC